MEKTMKVVHCKKELYDVYIGRPSKWGNPYVIGRDGTREDVIKLFNSYIRSNRKLMSEIGELKGKTLGCYCHPEACHGDILIDLANNNGENP
jgi:hypothetical protein